jgi:hypothetical protein
MADLCTELSIKHEEKAPYTPEQKGVAERANGVICARIRSVLAETGLLKELGAEIACTVAYLKNRSPTRSLKNKTPYKALYGTKSDLSHLIAIAMKVFVHIPKKKGKKMDFRLEASGILVGYGGSNQYRVWNSIDNKIIVSASFRFVGERKEVKEKDPGMSRSREPIIYDEIVVMPETKEFPNVDEMDEEEEDKEEDPEVKDNPEDDLATITTLAE